MICRLNHLKFHWSNCFDRGIILHANWNHKLNGSQESGCQLNFSAHAHQHVSVSVILLPFFPQVCKTFGVWVHNTCVLVLFIHPAMSKCVLSGFFRRFFFFNNSFWILIPAVKLREKKINNNNQHFVHDLKYVKIM